MTQQMAPSLDFEAMRRAIEGSDYDALMDLNADDAGITLAALRRTGIV